VISLCCLFHWQENYTEIFVVVDINKSMKMKYELRRNGKQTITFIFISAVIIMRLMYRREAVLCKTSMAHLIICTEERQLSARIAWPTSHP